MPRDLVWYLKLENLKGWRGCPSMVRPRLKPFPHVCPATC
jgi:hypothetical protein